MKNLFVKKNLIDCMCVFSKGLRQNNHELPLTCIANASSSLLTCPLHLFRKVLVMSVLLLSVCVGNAWGGGANNLGTWNFTNGTTMPSGATQSGGTAFATSRYCFDSANDYVTITPTIPNTATKLYVVVKGLTNGASSKVSTITVSGLNSSGTAIVGASGTYTSSYGSVSNVSQVDANTVDEEEISFSATNVSKIQIKCTTYGGSKYIVRSVTITYDKSGSSGSGDEATYLLTDLEDITSDDVVIIVGNNGNPYAMSNDNGTSSPPDAIDDITISGTTLTTSADNIQWNISQSGGSISAICPNGDDETWLYCTNTNNGVRVGTNTNKAFTIDNGYLKHTETSRYVGIYNSQDWRCYTSNGGNIADQTFSFYVLQTGSCDDDPTVGTAQLKGSFSLSNFLCSCRF